MSTNVGGIDRILRIVAGIALLLFAITGVPATGFNWVGWIGVPGSNKAAASARIPMPSANVITWMRPTSIPISAAAWAF